MSTRRGNKGNCSLKYTPIAITISYPPINGLFVKSIYDPYSQKWLEPRVLFRIYTHTRVDTLAPVYALCNNECDGLGRDYVTIKSVADDVTHQQRVQTLKRTEEKEREKTPVGSDLEGRANIFCRRSAREGYKVILYAMAHTVAYSI